MTMAGKLKFMPLYLSDLHAEMAGTLSELSRDHEWFWIRCLFLMWEAPRRGYLLHSNGLAFTPEQLAARLGSKCIAGEVTRWQQELVTAGTASRTPEGVIFCRRMVKDEHKRNLARERKSRERRGMSRECHADVAPDVTGRSQKPEARNQKPEPPIPPCHAHVTPAPVARAGPALSGPAGATPTPAPTGAAMQAIWDANRKAVQAHLAAEKAKKEAPVKPAEIFLDTLRSLLASGVVRLAPILKGPISNDTLPTEARVDDRPMTPVVGYTQEAADSTQACILILPRAAVAAVNDQLRKEHGERLGFSAKAIGQGLEAMGAMARDDSPNRVTNEGSATQTRINGQRLWVWRLHANALSGGQNP
jgi:hypothetical protein